jgi:hypothetical protein
MTEACGDKDEIAKARELYDRMRLGAYPDPTGDEFDLFMAIACRQEVADLICHVAFYAGFPSAGNAMRAAKQVFAELDSEASD